MERRHWGWLQRGVALVAVFGIALYAFRAGVAVSDRVGVPGAPLLAHIYYAAGLFVLGGMDLGTPVSGPPLALTLLWTSYFLAPLITTSAVLEVGLRIADSASLDRLGLRQHVVLVGLGRLATTFVQAARSWDPHCLLVALEQDVQRAAVRHVRRALGVRVFLGDALLPSSFAALRLGRARCVALLTDDDLLNLEVAYLASSSSAWLAVNTLLEAALIQAQRGWFSAARESQAFDPPLAAPPRPSVPASPMPERWVDTPAKGRS